MVNRRKRDLNILILALAGIVILNVLSSFFFGRIDFTAEKRYTLSEITKTILADMDDEVQVTVYLEGDFPAGFKRLRNSTADLLRDFKTYSNANLKFDFVNPLAGDQKSQEEAREIERIRMGTYVERAWDDTDEFNAKILEEGRRQDLDTVRSEWAAARTKARAEWSALDEVVPPDPREALDRLLAPLVALAGLALDDMTQDDGWLLLVLGRRLERLQFLATLVSQRLTASTLECKCKPWYQLHNSLQQLAVGKRTTMKTGQTTT